VARIVFLHQQIQQQQLQQTQSHLSITASALQNTIKTGNPIFLTTSISPTIKREVENNISDTNDIAAKKVKVLDESSSQDHNT
jgi:hypothetical protein